MLTNRTADQASSFTISLVDDGGAKIEGTNASWKLFDERGTPIASADITDFDPAYDAVTFDISADELTLSGVRASEGREIVVSVATDTGVIELRDYFLLVSAQPLALMVNSFVTYPEALSVRASFGPTMDGWDATLDRTTRSSALADAYERLLRIPFKVTYLDPMKHASSYAAYGTGTDEPFDMARRLRLGSLDITAFDSLPETFKKAIKRAQLIEANVILGGDIIGKKRQDGIVSESVGESAVVFQSKPYLNLPISRQAYEELKRYIIFHIGALRG